MKVLWVALMWTVLAGSAGAVPPSMVDFGPLKVWPPEARVYVLTPSGPVALGAASQVLSVPNGHDYLRLEVNADGYAPYPLTVAPDALPQGLPEHLELPATTFWTALVSLFRSFMVQCTVVLAVVLLAAGMALQMATKATGQLRRTGQLATRVLGQQPHQVAMRMGGYRILRVVGEGGMAVVYEACRDDTFPDGPRVAIKVIKAAGRTGSSYLERFRQEISITARLSHPGIVRVLDFGDHHGEPYLVMELLQGDTLQSVTSRQPLPLQPWLTIFGSLVEAVSYAHGHGVIHRDIKPGNIMLTPEGRAVIMDFGVARHEAASAHTRTGVVMGTPLYMAPEQLESKPATALSDQYSLGLTGYVVLTGRLPWDAKNAYAMVAQKMWMELPGVRSLRSDVPPALEAVIRRMMNVDPAQRFPDLRAVLAELSSIQVK